MRLRADRLHESPAKTLIVLWKKAVTGYPISRPLLQQALTAELAYVLLKVPEPSSSSEVSRKPSMNCTASTVSGGLTAVPGPFHLCG